MESRRPSEEGRDRSCGVILRVIAELAATAPQRTTTRAATAAETARLLERLLAGEPHRPAH